MKATRHPLVLSVILLSSASLVCIMPISARAGGDDTVPAPSKPRPDRAKKIFTNDDFEHPAAAPVAVPIAAPAEVETQPIARVPRARAQARPYVPEKDPLWYAEKVTSLNDELERTDADAQYLRNFRALGSTQGTGLILNAPCEGISTDNRIAQLDDRRAEILEQIDAFEDQARSNGLPPGIFVRASSILESSRGQARVDPQKLQASLRDQLRQAEDELAQTEAVVSEMEADTAARSMTLLRPNGAGGNMTTDLLQRLNAQAAALEEHISTVEDEARRSGVQPGFLR